MAYPNTAPTYQYIGGTNADGMVIGSVATVDKIGFWGATPIVRGTTAIVTVVADTIVASSSASAWCYQSSAQALAIVTNLNLVIRALASIGLISLT